MAGKLVVITGPMFSGKSTELLRRVQRARRARVPVVVLKPWIDTRSPTVRSHDGLESDAVMLRDAADVWRSLPERGLVAIDEAQFFDASDLLTSVGNLVRKGYDVVAAGLDLDYKGEPFGAMPQLMAFANEVVKLSAVCVRCGKDATRTQRLVNGEPAGLGPVVQIGGAESYEARCLDCWVPPSRVGLGTSE